MVRLATAMLTAAATEAVTTPSDVRAKESPPAARPG
jgi:hypothetical protein